VKVLFADISWRYRGRTHHDIKETEDGVDTSNIPAEDEIAEPA